MPGPDLPLIRRQQRHIDGQRRLLEAAEIIHRSLDSPSLETTILAEAVRLMDATGAALLIVRGDALVAAQTYGIDESLERLLVVPLIDPLVGRAVVNGETVAVEDVEAAGAIGSRLLGSGVCRGLLTAPLQSYLGTHGALVLFFDSVQRFSDDDQVLLHTLAIQAAIALDNRRLMHEKDQMAVRDGLTGAYNRSYLELALERSTKDLRRNGGVISVLFLDVDGMKAVNDSRGHQAGDRLLKDLAGLLAASCRETDIVARYGGDEFVVLMPATDAEGARRVAGKVDLAIAAHNTALAQGAVRLSASIGVHSAGRDDVDELLRVADRRMYEMKRSRGPRERDV